MNQSATPPEEPSLKAMRFGCAILIATPFLIAIAIGIYILADLAS